MAFLWYCLAVALIGFVNADEINYTDCGSEIGRVTAVRVSNCNTTMNRCLLKRNTDATLEIEFESLQDASEIKAKVFGAVAGATAPFNVPNPDACKNSGIQCPVTAGQKLKYQATFPILKKYNRVTVDINWMLKNGDKNFVCVVISAKIVK